MRLRDEGGGVATPALQTCAIQATWLPASEAGFTATRTCLYTTTPDEQFLVGPAPGLPGVVLAAGLSGHGFKLTPALGEALADLATGQACRFDLDFLAPDRAL